MREGVRPHVHHPDYSEPLTVQWLRPECHAATHNELGMDPDELEFVFRNTDYVQSRYEDLDGRLRPSMWRGSQMATNMPATPMMAPMAPHTTRVSPHGRMHRHAESPRSDSGSPAIGRAAVIATNRR